MSKYILIFFLFIACAPVENKQKRPLSHEKGIVVAMQYSAPADGDGSTISITSDGKLGVGSTHLHFEEKYMVVFRCEHNVVFSIDRQDLYAKLKQGDSVTIAYYELVNSEGTVVDLDFQDANPFINNQK